MKTRVPVGVYIVAVVQVLAVIMLPIDVLKGVSPVIWAIVAALFLLIGIDLIRRKAWSRLLSIFVQGMNIIVRLLVLVGHATMETELGGAIDTWMLGTSLASMVASMAVLYYLDLPDISMYIQEAGTSLSEVLSKVFVRRSDTPAQVG